MAKKIPSWFYVQICGSPSLPMEIPAPGSVRGPLRTSTWSRHSVEWEASKLLCERGTLLVRQKKNCIGWVTSDLRSKSLQSGLCQWIMHPACFESRQARDSNVCKTHLLWVYTSPRLISSVPLVVLYKMAAWPRLLLLVSMSWPSWLPAVAGLTCPPANYVPGWLYFFF